MEGLLGGWAFVLVSCFFTATKSRNSGRDGWLDADACIAPFELACWYSVRFGPFNRKNGFKQELLSPGSPLLPAGMQLGNKSGRRI